MSFCENSGFYSFGTPDKMPHAADHILIDNEPGPGPLK